MFIIVFSMPHYSMLTLLLMIILYVYVIIVIILLLFASHCPSVSLATSTAHAATTTFGVTNIENTTVVNNSLGPESRNPDSAMYKT